MRKSFDELTIVDDFMFCKVIQDEGICKEFLEIVLADKVERIAYLIIAGCRIYQLGIKVGAPRPACKGRGRQVL